MTPFTEDQAAYVRAAVEEAHARAATFVAHQVITAVVDAYFTFNPRTDSEAAFLADIIYDGLGAAEGGEARA